MKTLTKVAGIGLAGSFYFLNPSARADLEVQASVNIHAAADFYAPLTPHGAWVEVGGHGRCWRPARVAVGWRPYCEGYWTWTDCGWYWVSDEPWAWACYHYGCWMTDPAYGWVWVPGVEWGPAWVSWRVGGGYVGWGPLPPPHVTLVAGPEFVFVQESRFHDRVRPSTVIVNNQTVIQKTTVLNNIRHETRTIEGIPRKVVFNEGPKLEAMQQATLNHVKVVKIHEAIQQTPAPALKSDRPAPSAVQQPKQPEERRREGENGPAHGVAPAQPAPPPVPGQPQPRPPPGALDHPGKHHGESRRPAPAPQPKPEEKPKAEEKPRDNS